MRASKTFVYLLFHRCLYHEMCLRQWFLKKFECPLCRAKDLISTHVPNNGLLDINIMAPVIIEKRETPNID